MALARGRAELLGVGQPVGLAGQLVELAGAGVGGGQLVALELQQGPPALAFVAGLDQLESLATQRVVRGALLAIGRERLLMAAVRVEQRPLAVGLEEGAALVLAVDVDQPLAQRLERGDGHRQAVGMRGAAALRRDPAGQDELVVVERPA